MGGVEEGGGGGNKYQKRGGESSAGGGEGRSMEGDGGDQGSGRGYMRLAVLQRLILATAPLRAHYPLPPPLVLHAPSL